MVCVFVYARLASHGVVAKFFSPKFFRKPPCIALSVVYYKNKIDHFFIVPIISELHYTPVCMWINAWISYT
jgi:hypothetical protein